MVVVAQSNASKIKLVRKREIQNKSLINSLQQVYGAEQQWLTVLPILRLAIDGTGLVTILAKFQKEEEMHIKRLKYMLDSLGVEAFRFENKDMEVLIEECYDIIDITPRYSFIRNAGLIVGIQQLQQYQLTAYTSLLAQALELNEKEIVSLLKTTIESKQKEEEQLAMADTC